MLRFHALGDSAAFVLESSDGDEDIKEEIIRATIFGWLTEETEQVKHTFSTGNEKVVQVSTEISGALVWGNYFVCLR